MRLSHLTAIAAVMLGLSSASAFAVDYPNNAPGTGIPEPVVVNPNAPLEQGDISGGADVPVTYPNNDPGSLGAAAGPTPTSGGGPIAPIEPTYPNNAPATR